MYGKSRLLIASAFVAVVPVFIIAQEKPQAPQCCTPALSATVAAGSKDTAERKFFDTESTVCPKYRYAQYPTYSSYYSKLCTTDTNTSSTQIQWVSFDTVDIGSNPNADCSTGAGGQPGCYPGFREDKHFVRSKHCDAHDDVIRRGLKCCCSRDYAPTRDEGMALIKESIVKVNIAGGQVIYAKLFQMVPSVPDDGNFQVFGTGVETTVGSKELEIKATDVTVVPPRFQDANQNTSDCQNKSHCVRFTIKKQDYPSAVLADTEFQVITSTPIALPVAQPKN